MTSNFSTIGKYELIRRFEVNDFVRRRNSPSKFTNIIWRVVEVKLEYIRIEMYRTVKIKGEDKKIKARMILDAKTASRWEKVE